MLEHEHDQREVELLRQRPRCKQIDGAETDPGIRVPLHRDVQHPVRAVETDVAARALGDRALGVTPRAAAELEDVGIGAAER